MDETVASLRQAKRYNHITIGLHFQHEGEWHNIQAIFWNTAGFSFYCDIAINAQELTFKKGIHTFSGKVVWSQTNEDDSVILEAILNAALFSQIKAVASSRETAHRIARLIRSAGKVDEKKKLLAHTGAELGSDEEIAARIAQFKKDHSTYRYGIQVDAAAWSNIVGIALETSAIVLALEQVSNGLSGKEP